MRVNNMMRQGQIDLFGACLPAERVRNKETAKDNKRKK